MTEFSCATFHEMERSVVHPLNLDQVSHLQGFVYAPAQKTPNNCAEQ